MRYSKPLALFICILIPISVVYGFYGEGTVDPYEPPQPDVEGVCFDGNDNDGDGQTDSSDPGCTKPYHLDRAEEDVRDSDATYAFTGGAPNQYTPTPAYPGWYKPYQAAGWNGWGDSGSGNTISEQFARNENNFWAAGSRITEDVTVDSLGADAVIKSYGFMDAVVTKNASSDISSGVCGNGDRDSGEGDNMDCPEDWGLPDDMGRTESNSPLTISHGLTTFESVTSPFTGNQDDPVNYIMDLEGVEANGYDTDTITGLNGGGDTSELYEYESISNDPDYYNVPGNRDRVKMVYLETEEKEIGSVTDYNPTTSQYDHYTSTSGSVDYNCDDSGTVNVSCTGPSGDYCRENNGRTITRKEVDGVYTSYSSSPQSSPSQDTKRRYTSKSGTYDYTREESSEGITINVYYDKRVDGPEIDAYECTSSSGDYGCKETGNGHSGWCDFDTDYSIYSNDGPKSIQDGYESSTKTYNYEKLVWSEEDIFDTNPSESPTSTKYYMFGGDFGLGIDSHPRYSDIIYANGGGRAYWTVGTDQPTAEFSNDPAVSSSSFKVELEGNTFVSKRDWYGVYDADGTDGGGDSFVPVKEGSVVTDGRPLFANETKIVSSDGTTVGAQEASLASFVDGSTYSPEGCPSGFRFCVEAADVQTQALTSWSDPSNAPQNAGSGLDFNPTVAHVNESWSVCRLYQKQIGGSDNSYLRCQFDNARNYPDGPTPSYRAGILPFNPANSE